MKTFRIFKNTEGLHFRDYDIPDSCPSKGNPKKWFVKDTNLLLQENNKECLAVSDFVGNSSLNIILKESAGIDWQNSYYHPKKIEDVLQQYAQLWPGSFLLQVQTGYCNAKIQNSVFSNRCF